LWRLHCFPFPDFCRRGGASENDNLPAHKVPGVKELIEAFGATVQYLPQAADRF
jgi:hypothetical protein